jgi:hypothetical protein
LKKKIRTARPGPEKIAEPRQAPKWFWPALIALCVLVFYWVPMTSASASIQWDAADMHYPLQKYFSDHLRSGSLPFWTPYIFSGFPLLANPEIGAWYLPHWPFFLMGITPRSIQFELALNAFLACLGTWLLLSRLVGNRAAAAVGAFCYGLSGFFAGHSSHVGLFSAAAGLPWLLLAFDHARESRALRHTALGGLAGGMIILAGYFQTALFSFTALGLYALADLCRAPRQWRRTAGILAGIAAIALAVSAIETIPGLELTKYSIRAGADFSRSGQGSLQPGALATLVAPNALGAITGPYTGPSDITQYYFYAGLFLLPLAAFGLRNREARLRALVLIAPAAWYMLGPAAGLYRLGGFLPGFGKVRAPVQGWFVAAFGLALLAAAGFAWIARRWKLPYLAPLVLAVLFADLWYWNSWSNPLAYARAGFDQLYGNREEIARREIAPALPPLTRLEGPPWMTALGPVDHPLDVRMETTYGYFALELNSYDQYRDAMKRNRRLRDGLNISGVIDLEHGRIEANPTVLPRAYFPKTVADVAGEADSLKALETLDPASGSIVLAPHPPIRQDASATASVVWYDERAMRVKCRAASPSLLRLSVPWFPGWRAAVDGGEAPIVRVDHALMGVVVPPGAHEVYAEYQPRYFGLAFAISLAGALGALAAVAWSFRKGGAAEAARATAPSAG